MVSACARRLALASLAIHAVACVPAPAPGAVPASATATATASASASAPAPASASAPASATASSSGAASPLVVGRARGPLATEADAIRAFRAAWAEEILPRPRTRPPELPPYSRDVADQTRVSAHRIACREALHRVTDTLSPREGDLILFSQKAALDREGQCWEVVVRAGHWNEILGHLDPKTGALLFSWLVPEG